MTGEQEVLLRLVKDKRLTDELVELFYKLEKSLPCEMTVLRGQLTWKRVEGAAGPTFSAEDFVVRQTGEGVALDFKGARVLALDLRGRVIVPGAQVFGLPAYEMGDWEEPFRSLRGRSSL